MNEDARGELQPVIRAGESLLWAGRPDPAWRWRRGDLAATATGVVFGAFITFWLSLAIGNGAPFFFPLFGSVFALFALWMLIGRWFYRAARARRTAYGLTPTRAYIVVKGSVTTHPLRESLTVRRSGEHVDVVFADETRPGRGWTAVGNTGAEFIMRSRYDAAFYDVADADGLLGALDRAQRSVTKD
ncbi:hypothetical protein JL107_08970 [Nakamurella flavida]|uniref:PH domain-containing protein n=1 Tax=Nakamurella flavida TaxID=363630 RepID=A0A938YIH9_9ACTN|nr:hypothetical protein [Nakamurella flavida]MBM9476572.1 hypothetical protein [Nakamurella flavida]MDP9778990.1 hypothetical protein [Nakamurella flavida]